MVRAPPVLLLAAALLAMPILTGCLGMGGEDDGSEPVQKQRADVDEQLGGIQGVVTDQAIQPVVGANVTLVETNTTVQTADDGSYAFSLVEPGTYTVSIKDPGYVTAQETATVEANQAVNVDFILTHLFTREAYTQQVEYAAFIECGIGAQVPFVISVTLAACGVPNDILPGGNATNDDFIEFLSLEPPIHTLVWEAQWDSSGNTLGENLWLVAEIQGHVNSGDPNATVYRDISAPSPFRAQINKSHFDNVSANFKSQCEDGDDTYCGYSFQDKGWPLAVRTFTAADCTGTPLSACAPLQLKVDHVFTGFYNAPAPEGYTVFGGAN